MIDFLIVGGGFSGIAFSWELEKRNIPYKIYDPCIYNSSTIISGAVINPVSGRKYKKQWNIDLLLPLIKNEFALIESAIGQKIVYPSPIFKIHKSEDALEEWLNMRGTVDKDYVDEEIDIAKWNRFLDFRFGGIMINNGLRIDPVALSNSYFKYIGDRHIKSVIDYNKLFVSDNEIIYEGEKYAHVVFCEGVGALQNPWLHSLPFKPAKGECLLIEIPNFRSDTIINKGIILIPLEENIYWAGATNTWNDLTPYSTEEGSAELIDALSHLLKVPYTIIEKKAGIRPTMRDRRPIVGRHNKYPNLLIINGMGTKGASLSTYYAQQLLSHVFDATEIPSEANVNRFY